MKLKNMYILARKVEDFMVFIGYSGDSDYPYDTYTLDGSIALFTENPVLFNTIESANEYRAYIAKALINYEQELAVNAGYPGHVSSETYYLNFEIMTLKELAVALGTTFKEMKKASIEQGLHKEWAKLDTIFP